ncbi:MAG: hypothetical protein KC591_17935, partial [Gemmatimonadetes bacterium]|nr:hypothetical protein [Gemmatimonadota bacterium]
MRGYRRRSGLAYLLGVAAACGLTFSVIAALLQLPDTAWWGLRARADGIVRRVAEDSPAARAGVEKSDRVILFGGQPWALSELVSAKPGDTVRARIRATDDTEREVALRAEPMPGPERVRKILFGVVALSFLLTGLVVYLSRSDAVANLFAAMCLLFAHQVAPAAPPTSFAGLFAKKLLLDLSTLALPSVVLHFFLLFPQRARFLRAGAYRSWLLYVPAIVAMPLAIRFDLDLFRTGRISSAAEIFEATSALVFVAMIAWGVASFLRGVRNTESPPLRKSLRWVLPGTAAGILPPLVFAALLNVVPDLELPLENYAFATLVLVPLTFGHAIVRYGLLDLQLVVKRSVLYAAVTAAVVVAYWLVAEIVAGLVGRSGNERTIVSFAVIFAAALLSIPARERIDRWLDHLLYRDRFDYRRTVRRFSNHFATMIERDQLGQLLVNRIPELLQTERAVLFLRTSRDEA